MKHSLTKLHVTDAHMSEPYHTHTLQIRGRSAKMFITYRPTKFSNTLLFPALWLPTTAICGRSSVRGTPKDANASCNLFTIGINCSMPKFPAILSQATLRKMKKNYILYENTEKC